MSTVPHFSELTEELQDLVRGGYPETVSMEVRCEGRGGAALHGRLDQTDAGPEGGIRGVFAVRDGVHVDVGRTTRGETHVAVAADVHGRLREQLGLHHAHLATATGATLSGAARHVAYRLGVERAGVAAVAVAVAAGGWSIGAHVGVHTHETSASGRLERADVAATYRGGDFTASVATGDFGRTRRFGFVHAPHAHPGAKLGAELVSTEAEAEAVMTLAAHVPLPAAGRNHVRLRADTTGRVDVAVSLQLHPVASLVVASAVHTAHLHDPAAHRVGAALAFDL